MYTPGSSPAPVSARSNILRRSKVISLFFLYRILMKMRPLRIADSP